jgi:hypothetical protein
VSIGSTISTGFGARAEIEAGEATLSVSPLTRLTIEELAREQNNQRTDLFLGVGRVRANVRTGEDTTHDFQLRSSVSTAAVRGTEFEYDGFWVRGFTGTVVFVSPEGITQTVQEGDFSSFDGPSPQPTSPRQERRSRSRPDPRPTPQTRERRAPRPDAGPPPPPQASSGGGRRGPQEEFEDVETDATITVDVTWPN